MARTMSAREARAHFADVLGSVYYTNEPVIVERNGKQVAVVISPEQYASFLRAQEQAWALVDAVRERNAGADRDEVLADVTAEVEAARQELHERRERTASCPD